MVDFELDAAQNAWLAEVRDFLAAECHAGVEV